MLKLGIAGIGAIAKDYIGLICEGRVEGVELTALCSRTLDHVRAVQAEFPALRSAAVFSDYAAMLASGSAEAVLICTPHGQHPAMALQAVEAGLHVLVEKPVGIDPEAVYQVLSALEKRPKLVCGVMYNRRMSPAYRSVKELLEDGAIGALVRATWLITNLYRTDAYYGSSPWRGTWREEGGGILMTQASHQLDLMQWLCGMPRSVLARCATVGRSIEVENEAELLLEFPGGARGQFIASAHECPGTNRLELCGTLGRITVVDDTAVEVVRLAEDERKFAVACPSPFEKPSSTANRDVFEGDDNKTQQAAAIHNFAQACAGLSAVFCDLRQGLNSLELIQGAYLSARKARGLTLPRPADEFMRTLGLHGT